MVTNSKKGAFSVFRTMVEYKLDFPSGNTIQLPGGDYLVLSLPQKDVFSSIQTGAHRTYNSVTSQKVGTMQVCEGYVSRRQGNFNIFYPRSKSLLLPSGNAVTLPQGDHLTLYSEIMSGAKNGAHRVYNLKLSKALGSFRLFNSLGQAQQGEYKVYRIILSAQTGTYSRGSISKFSKIGTYNVRREITLQMESGYGRLLENVGFRKQGRYRVENADKSGYLIYIGYGSMPDLTGPADAFSATLPTSVLITPPEVGTEEIFVVVRSRNSYGLVSQNQKPSSLTVDSAGNEELGPITAPDKVEISCITDDGFLVSANYSGYFSDRNRGDVWEVYLKAGEVPVPGVDEPAAVGDVKGAEMQSAIGPYAETGEVYYLVVGIRRTIDNATAFSEPVEIYVPAAPSAPMGVN